MKTAKGEPDRIENVINDLKHEIVQCQRLNHVNIVQFLGACRGTPPAGVWKGEQLMLVNELMAISLFEQLCQLVRDFASPLRACCLPYLGLICGRLWMRSERRTKL